jgi:hypothetical protein
MNAMTINPEDLNEAVRATAMLADVTISTWAGERTDQDVTRRIRDDAAATGDVGRFVKKLLAGVDGTLKNTQSAFAAMRVKHYGLTLPWVSDAQALRNTGPRLLPNMLFERYMSEMSAAKRIATEALDKFIYEYPDLVLQAKTNLGGLADAIYPTPDEVRARFRVSFDFEPIPAGQSFKGLPPHLLAKLSQGLANKQNRMINAATTAMWSTVRDRVGFLEERMNHPEKPVFKANTVENVRELITLIPGWNVVADPRADEVARAIDAMLHGVTPDTIRSNGDERAHVGRQARGILASMDQWGV